MEKNMDNGMEATTYSRQCRAICGIDRTRMENTWKSKWKMNEKLDLYSVL